MALLKHWGGPLCLAVWLSSTAGHAADTCTTGRCHASQTNLAHTHTALKWGCTSCHVARDKPKHRFDLIATGRRLCNLCHTWPARRHTHAALKAEPCTVCHDPHGSANRANLTDWPVSNLCSKCHPGEPALARTHRPFKEGGCTECHEPHQSDNARLLRKSGPDLCGRCHSAEKILKNPFKHKPVETGDCSGCHSAHQSSHASLLRKEGKALCLSCHKDKPNLKRKYVHEAMSSACSTCHAAHSAKSRGLLLRPTPDLCYDCHERQDTAPVVHSALKLGRCAGCHEPHASDQKKLLTGSFAGDLCFRCHCDDATQRASVHWPVRGLLCDKCHAPHGAKVKNLLLAEPKKLCQQCHARLEPGKGLRVHGALERAGCQACHDTHGSSAPHLLKKSVNELCSACHPNQADGAHVFTRPDGRPHPVGGTPDPLFANRTLSCVTCHAMTASTNPKLLRASDKLTLCGLCHVGGYGRPSVKPRPQAPEHEVNGQPQKKGKK